MARTKSSTSNKPDSKKEETNNDEFTQGPRESKDSSAAIRNKKKLEEDGAYIEIPDVSDIPGQENVRNAGIPGEMADTTISSDDEEGVRSGKDILEEGEDDLEIVMGTEADVTKEDLAMLGDPDKDMDDDEDERIPSEGLDDVDNEGDPLNEGRSGIASTGDDLDIPKDDDPDNEDEMEGDEENDYYSLGGDDEDDNDNGTPNEYREKK